MLSKHLLLGLLAAALVIGNLSRLSSDRKSNPIKQRGNNLNVLANPYEHCTTNVHPARGRSEDRNVYLLMAATNKSSVFTTFTQMQTQLGYENVFLLLDDSLLTWTYTQTHRLASLPWPQSAQVLLFNESDCQTAYPAGTYMEHWQEPALFLLMRGLQARQLHVDYVWTFESDVVCNGDFAKCVEPSMCLDDDLLCCEDNVPFAADPQWYWWSHLEGEIASVSFEERRRCFQPLRRFSTRALEVIFAARGKSWGYLEMLYPTLLTHANLTVRRFPEESLGQVLYYHRKHISPAETALRDATVADNKFYHPIKI